MGRGWQTQSIDDNGNVLCTLEYKMSDIRYFNNYVDLYQSTIDYSPHEEYRKHGSHK